MLLTPFISFLLGLSTSAASIVALAIAIRTLVLLDVHDRDCRQLESFECGYSSSDWHILNILDLRSLLLLAILFDLEYTGLWVYLLSDSAIAWPILGLYLFSLTTLELDIQPPGIPQQACPATSLLCFALQSLCPTASTP